jgi:hypothetical protein
MPAATHARHDAVRMIAQDGAGYVGRTDVGGHSVDGNGVRTAEIEITVPQ